MNNSGFNKFLKNKNTVTVVMLTLAVGILYFAYTFRVKQATTPVRVPYATSLLKPGTQITQDKVGERQIPKSMLTGDVLTKMSEVVDKYVAPDTVIPAQSIFYKRTVFEEEQLPGNIILKYPSGYVLYNLAVNSESTYGNSVYPGNYIDIYLKAVTTKTDKDGKQVADTSTDSVMYGKLLSNVKVLAVKDSTGAAVFSNLEEQKTPSMVVFAVPEEYYILLKKAEYMNTYATELVLVPTNEGNKDNPADVKLASEDLKNWINQKTIWTKN